MSLRICDLIIPREKRVDKTRSESLVKIWVTRHGQTDLNAGSRMQGRSDIPLNEIGIGQAKSAREKIGDIKFDAVYSSPLIRAVKTAEIVGNVSADEIIKDERIIEADFGKYEQKSYYACGPFMTLYWTIPEFFPAPKGVETVAQMVERTRSFLQELEQKDYENVLVTCHGGIIRFIRGYLEDEPKGFIWRPRPKNCEIRVYETDGKTHKLVDDIL